MHLTALHGGKLLQSMESILVIYADTIYLCAFQLSRWASINIWQIQFINPLCFCVMISVSKYKIHFLRVKADYTQPQLLSSRGFSFKAICTNKTGLRKLITIQQKSGGTKLYPFHFIPNLAGIHIL